MHNVDVAVFMPIYNAEDFVEEAMLSVLKQDGVSFIIIAYDDCSSDNSANIVENIQAKHKDKIVFLKNSENVGPNNNFNNILNYIQGNVNCTYIAFFAGDDLMKHNRLLYQKTIMDECLNSAICFCHVEILNSGRKDDSLKNIIGKVSDKDSSYKYDYMLRKGFAFVTNGAFLRSSELKNIRYRYNFVSDFHFFIDIAMKSRKDIIFINNDLVYYRRSQGSVTSKYSKKSLMFGYMKYSFRLIKDYPAYIYFILKNLLIKLLKNI